MQKASLGATRIAVSILWTTPIEFPASAMRRVMVHPYMMAFLGTVFVVVVLANEQPAMQHVPFVYRAMLYLASVIMITGVTVGWMLWRAYRAKGDIVHVDLTLVLVIAQFAILPFVDWFERVMFLQEPFSTLQLVVRILFYISITVIGLAVLFSFFGTEISRDATRAKQDQQPASARTPAKRPVSIAGEIVDLDRLVLMRAQTSKVEIVTQDGVVSVAGPLAERMADLPQGSGRLVHRHIWVRDEAVIGHRMVGRDLTILLMGGQSVQAAASRHTDLLPWLSSLSAQNGQGTVAVQASNKSD